MSNTIRMDLVEKYIKLVESFEEPPSAVNDAWDILTSEEKAQVRKLRTKK